MRLSDEAFRASLARAREVERAIARFIMGRGSRILPVYDYSGLDEDKAPKLQAYSASDSLVTPDLLVARAGSVSWCEIKWKSSAFLFRNTNEFETGIDLRLWQQYRMVKQATGCRVFLVFAHESENIVTCDEIDILDKMPSKRQSPRGRSIEGRRGHPPMVNWPLRHLYILADYSTVISGQTAVVA